MALSVNSNRNLCALLLAGGEAPKEIQADDGSRKLCLAKLGGMTLLERAVRTIKGAFPDARVLVNLGRDDEGLSLIADPAFGSVICYSGASDVLGALEQGLDLLEADGAEAFDANLLLLTVDIPLLTEEQLAEFVNLAQASEADGVWPIVERASVVARFPGSQRTYVRTQQGTFTGGNGFLVRPWLLRDNAELLRKVYSNRKNPMALAGIFGMGLVMKLMSGRISLSELEVWFSKRFNARLKLLQFPHPEIAVDIDKYSDFLLAREILG